MTNSQTAHLQDKKFNIYERVLQFAVRTVSFVNALPKTQAGIEYGRQLLRASASIGANLEEADGALTTKDFINKVGISRREAREARYWIRLIEKCRLAPESQKESDWLVSEAMELMLILSAIIKSTQRNKGS
jgi:four helix bundle protein